MLSDGIADLVVIGGGVVGLSIADEASRAGLEVTVVERGLCGREASWAGAGILPPRSWYVDHPALDWLAARSEELYPSWSERLLQESGIDNEYWRCGARYSIESSGNTSRGTIDRWRRLGVRADATSDGTVAVPAEAQVRNPRHLKALVRAIERRGVRILEHTEVAGFKRRGRRIEGLATDAGTLRAGAVCLAAGCWAPALAKSAAARAPGKPIRGQMLLLRPAAPPPTILHRPPWYAAPRRDGLVLVGATVEDVGFARGVTDDARTALRNAAEALWPGLGAAPAEGFWSGLRPASGDPLPVVGRLGDADNLFIASGHHRSGLQFAPPTAEIIVGLLRGEAPPREASVFDPARFADRRALTTA